MKPELERGITNLATASFKAFRLCQPAFESHWHYHPELELVYFARGKGVRFIGDAISLYDEGSLFLIGESLPHTFVSYADEQGELVEAYCIQFPPNLLDSFAECKPLAAFFESARCGLSFPNPAAVLVTLLKETVHQTGTAALVRLIELLDRLSNVPEREPILQQAYQRHAVMTGAATRIRTAVDYINTHYQRPVSLQEIAHACHFSPNAFCRWFRQHMGVTFVDYLNKVRLTHVCQLLTATDLPISQIATQAGFDNISTLNRLFQARLGTSPGKYRAGVLRQ
ncbi:putative HTH-type transcriptional regulator yisR [Fibrella aestuarina BUZ 2]|uniref:Putative HTH-type transcriptional regulator yisR n=1 Tax=Fibrella aestuarina BUZ 2 TaxID=1166018 RepID=I0KGM1_9BACT|nr:AraC family transcriptional regulator [Fibrella aestuarina]CCH03274.1 putative HTH-type transcriptional regulator yisR [Fibrella aestuarina BUZ 2]